MLPRLSIFLQDLEPELVEQLDGMTPDAALIPVESSDPRECPVHRPVLVQLGSRDEKRRLVLQRLGSVDVPERQRLARRFPLHHRNGFQLSPGGIDIDLREEPAPTPLWLVRRQVKQQVAILADHTAPGVEARPMFAAFP